MTPLILALILISTATYVLGQLALKHALAERPAESASKWKRVTVFVGSIAAMTVSFFINLGLLQKLDLSYFYPFQGLNVVLVVLCALLFLKERLTLQLGLGVLLIACGVTMVSMS